MNGRRLHTRRSALARGIDLAAAFTTTWVIVGEAEADSANKAPQQAAGYQAQPNAGKKCSGCANFHAPDGCSIVQGPISPDGWCRLYRDKTT